MGIQSIRICRETAGKPVAAIGVPHFTYSPQRLRTESAKTTLSYTRLAIYWMQTAILYWMQTAIL